MPYQTTGFNPDTYKRLLIGPGAVYLDYELPTEALLGATRGGNTFDPGVTVRDVEVDGVKGRIRGGRILDRVEPVLRANLLEMSKANIMAAIPGLQEELVEAGDPQATEYELDLGSANAGTYTLKHGALETEDIDWDADVDEVQLHLETLFGKGNVTVTTANGFPYTIAFALALGDVTLEADFTSVSLGNEEEPTLVETEEYASGDSYHKLTLAEITDGAYFTNVAIVGRISGSNKPVVAILRNVLAGGDFSMAFEAQGEMVSELQLQAHFAAPTPGQSDAAVLKAIMEIRYPPDVD